MVVRTIADEAQAYLRCRTYGHAWDEFAPIDLNPPAYGWRLCLRCTRCMTERYDNVDFKGRVMSRRYVYPERYAQKGVTRVEFRESLFQALRAKLEASKSIGATPTPARKSKAS
jgi:hypothetical protein